MSEFAILPFFPASCFSFHLFFVISFHEKASATFEPKIELKFIFCPAIANTFSLAEMLPNTMLTAKYKDTNEELDITKFDNPREQIDKNRLCCKFCEQPMSIRDGMLRAKHFYHLNPCTSDYERHPESPQHNLGKELIAKHLKLYWKEYVNSEIKLEFPIEDMKRIIDIAMVFPTGWIVAHELQLAPITLEHLEKRTNDYREHGIDTFWWFGKSADTKTNREWAIERFGQSLSIDYELLDAEIKNIQKGKEI